MIWNFQRLSKLSIRQEKGCMVFFYLSIKRTKRHNVVRPKTNELNNRPITIIGTAHFPTQRLCLQLLGL